MRIERLSATEAGRRSPGLARGELRGRLRSRCREIERATIDCVCGLPDTEAIDDPVYRAGLRAAVSTALASGIDAIAESPHPKPLPPQLLAQARLAARSGVCLDTVLRRYFAGYAILCDYIVEEAGAGDLKESADLQSVLRSEAVLLERFVVAATSEYSEEAAREQPLTISRRRLRVAEALLAGQRVDPTVLDYDLDVVHVGLVANGSDAPGHLRALASSLGCACLVLGPGEDVAWAWMAGRPQLDSHEILRRGVAVWPRDVPMALGEAAHGPAGWRLTHRQAVAALSICEHENRGPVRYADVALVASTLQDELLCRSLEDLYLIPLCRDRDGGATIKGTLRAYLLAERNVSSTAAALGVSRQTITNRLRLIEERLGQPLGTCAIEVDLALRIDELQGNMSTDRRQTLGTLDRPI